MLILIKNISISAVISLAIFIGLRYLNYQALQIPISKADFSELLIIFIGLLASTSFVSATTNSYSEEYELRETGTVKWFNDAKGFGFIERQDGEDVFVHFRSIQGEGYRTLKQGAQVEFGLSETEKGFQAEDVAEI